MSLQIWYNDSIELAPELLLNAIDGALLRVALMQAAQSPASATKRLSFSSESPAVTVTRRPLKMATKTSRGAVVLEQTSLSLSALYLAMGFSSIASQQVFLVSLHQYIYRFCFCVVCVVWL